MEFIENVCRSVNWIISFYRPMLRSVRVNSDKQHGSEMVTWRRWNDNEQWAAHGKLRWQPREKRYWQQLAAHSGRRNVFHNKVKHSVAIGMSNMGWQAYTTPMVHSKNIWEKFSAIWWQQNWAQALNVKLFWCRKPFKCFWWVWFVHVICTNFCFKWSLTYEILYFQNITVFPIKPWTPEKFFGMFIVLRPIRCKMKPQKTTDKPQQG